MGILLTNAAIAVQMASGVCVFGYFGLLTPLPLPLGPGAPTEAYSVSAWLLGLAVPYAEFWAISLFKDVSSMHILHRMMHSKRYPWLYAIHRQHHQSKEDMSLLSAAQIHGADLFIENGCGPALLVAVKALVGLPLPVSLGTFWLLLFSEGQAHSLNPYAVCYFLPPLDFVIKGNIAHNLHHVTQSSHYTLVPWNHFWRGYRGDLKRYNEVMGTDVAM